MDVTIAIRREDRNEWERRAPLTPADLAELASGPGARFRVQPSDIRVFDDSEYAAAGAEVAESLDDASVVLAIKEIPIEVLRPGTTRRRTNRPWAR